MAKYVCVCMVCMSAICTDEQMDFPIGLPELASLSAHGFILKFWVTIIGRCKGRDDMGGYLHLHIELETLRVYMYVHDGQVNEEMDSHIRLPKFGELFGSRFHFETQGNRHRSMWGSGWHGWISTSPHRVGNSLGLHVCTRWTSQRGDGLSHHWKLTSLSALGSIFERFLGTDVGWCEGHTLGRR